MAEHTFLDPSTLAAAAQRLEISNAAICLHDGELTAGEMRAVQAVLAWKARVLRALTRPAGDEPALRLRERPKP